MRLINLHTLELREFIDSERPPYVILSHTWGAEEVTLQQLQPDASTHIPFLQYKEGYLKVRNFAREGRQNGFEWGWVDTCCIDKTSSAELSEAINSMYRWYEEADSCYAYFSDVPRLDSEGQPESSLEQQFAASRWFTRGWTLQELLAPSSVVFYLNNWTVYGTKGSLRKEISIITCIPEEAIKEPEMTNFTVGQRISWVSRRQTTRPEDLSYCLLGILGVNMPMLYGEGSRAFIRLQEEVLKISTDSTIFAW
ncbi:HET-domain-containing protein, partial [Stipitochalara longipes BDJ]